MYSIYVSDLSRNMIGRFNKEGVYVSKTAATTFKTIFYIEAIDNGNIYATLYNGSGESRVLVYNSLLQPVSSYLLSNQFVRMQRQIRYNPINNLVYELDTSTKWLNAFQPSNLVRVPGASVKLSSSVSAVGLAFYQSYDGTAFVYVSTTSNIILVYSNGLVVSTILSICPFTTTNSRDLTIDKLSGYMIVSCYSDNQLRLWHTDGYKHKNTNMSLSLKSPVGSDYDSNGRLAVISHPTSLLLFDPVNL